MEAKIDETVENNDVSLAANKSASLVEPVVYTAKDLKVWLNRQQLDDSESCTELLCSACSHVKSACTCSATCLRQKAASWLPIATSGSRS